MPKFFSTALRKIANLETLEKIVGPNFSEPASRRAQKARRCSEKVLGITFSEPALRRPQKFRDARKVSGQVFQTLRTERSRPWKHSKKRFGAELFGHALRKIKNLETHENNFGSRTFQKLRLEDLKSLGTFEKLLCPNFQTLRSERSKTWKHSKIFSARTFQTRHSERSRAWKHSEKFAGPNFSERAHRRADKV